MISLSRVVKSMAVVDDRRQRPDIMKAWIDGQFTDKAVLKGGAMSAYGIAFYDQPVTRDAYVDEVNRLRIDAEEARAELRRIRREIEEEKTRAKREAEKLAEAEAERTLQYEVDRSILDDELFEARRLELEGLAAQAEARAKELLESAQAEAGEIKEHARAEGYGEGFEKGYEEAGNAFRSEVQPKLDELSELISALTSYSPGLMREKERELVALTVAIAGKVVGREIKSDPGYILDMLREAAQRNQRESYVAITLSPDMLPLKIKASEEVIASIEQLANNISVYVEKETGEGVCLLETPKGVTDMSLSTQLENIKESLLE